MVGYLIMVEMLLMVAFGISMEAPGTDITMPLVILGIMLVLVVPIMKLSKKK